MKLVSFGDAGSERPGLLAAGDRIVPLDEVPGVSGDMNAILAQLPELRPRLAGLSGTVSLADVRLGPPVPHPGAIIAVGANYRAHITEIAGPAGPFPDTPVLFSKPAAALGGPYDPVVRPVESAQLDYECELAVVIGRGGRRIPREQALAHVAGYLIANDVTARDVFLGEMHKSPAYLQIMRGKGADTFCPTGPWLLTADQAPAPDRFRLRTWVNDELRQDGTTAQMIFDVPALVSSVSDAITLRPGDLILTGTPSGVGSTRQPPCFLQPGDTVRMEITGLGVMATPIRDER
ncbi:fumarylacetoacetate hydrolase family protein [Amycolatopsis silviterrae]|uniref:Fumarylacetoacetate hydrolase family protein n=1 Tax=Amycolatopsis silviterrae TaxID=1656914 RepID=A0ABW5HP15_9PSEU